MNIQELVESLPLWITFIGIVGVVLLSAAVGIYAGRRWRERASKDSDEPIGIAVGATLGLLGFMLAFTFGLTASRFDSRKQLLLDEVAAIETTSRQADLIPEPHRTEVHNLIKKYIELRLEALQDLSKLPALIKQSEELQRQMWAHAAALAASDLKNADIVSVFVESLSEMMNLQTRRVAVASYHIPGLIWIILMVITVLTMIGVGYLFGKAERVNWLTVMVLVLAFSGVVILNVDLDRSGVGAAGWIQVSQQPLFDLHERLYPATQK